MIFYANSFFSVSTVSASFKSNRKILSFRTFSILKVTGITTETFAV